MRNVHATYDTELAVLGAAIRYPAERRLVLTQLSEDDFREELHRFLFTTLDKMQANGIDIDPTTVAASLGTENRGDVAQLVPKAYEIAPVSARSYIDLISQEARKGRWTQRLDQASATVESGDFERAEAQVLDLLTSSRNGKDPNHATAAKPVAWPQLDPAARHGLAGSVVGELEPHTEADPAGLLASYLSAFGNAVGPGPHAMADGSQHPARLNLVLVGETSRSRKGTCWRNVERVFHGADTKWIKRVMGGLASGEGLIKALNDEDDHRLMAVEPEFARVLAVAGRDGSTLSAIVREAWDTGTLRVLTRNDPLSATGAHVTVLGHITLEELRTKLVANEAANGFANRFLFCCVRRGRLLPSGGSLDLAALEDLSRRTRKALTTARKVGVLRRSPDTEDLWAELYHQMAEQAPAGLVGACTARADAQTLRLSVCYALLDGSRTIEVPHLQAAWAMWRYCEDSAGYVFGDSLGDDVADRLLEAVREAGADGLDAKGQHDVFGRHVSADRLDQARTLLEERNLIYTIQQPTGGRPRTVSYPL